MMTALHPRCIEFPTAGHLCLGPRCVKRPVTNDDPEEDQPRRCDCATCGAVYSGLSKTFRATTSPSQHAGNPA